MSDGGELENAFSNDDSDYDDLDNYENYEDYEEEDKDAWIDAIEDEEE